MVKNLFIYKFFHISHILSAVYSKDLLWLTVSSEHRVMKSSACDEILCN